MLVSVGTPLDTTASHHEVYGNMCSGFQHVSALAFNNAFDTTASHHDVYGSMCSGFQHVSALAFNNAFL